MKIKPLQRILILSTLFLSACSAPEIIPDAIAEKELKQEQLHQLQQVLLYQHRQIKRVDDIAFPLLEVAAKECGSRVTNRLGIRLHKLDEYSDEYQPAITALYGETAQLRILTVTKQSPAEGKLKPGDIVLGIDNSSFGKATVIQAVQMLRSAAESNTVISLNIKRNNEEQTINIKPVTVCDYPVVIAPNPVINGYTDGIKIQLTDGLLRFTKHDKEIAFILAHELAHNTSQHIPKRILNSAIGALTDIALLASGIPSPGIATAVSSQRYNQAYETEADLEAIRIMQLAGYDIDNIESIWRSLAQIGVSHIEPDYFSSHPSSAQRYLQIKKKIAEIKNSGAK